MWWLVTPGNPLKPNGPAPMVERMAQARAMMQHPRVRVSDIEAQLGTTYTAKPSPPSTIGLRTLGLCG